MFVFDDYAENIQQNQVKTVILARYFPVFFEIKRRFRPDFQGKDGTGLRWPDSDSYAAGGVAQTPSKTGLSPRSSRR